MNSPSRQGHGCIVPAFHCLRRLSILSLMTVFSATVWAAAISNVQLATENSLAVTFDDAMGVGVTDAANYLIAGPGAGDRTVPNSVSQSVSDPNTYFLHWNSGFFNLGGLAILSVSDTVEDSGGTAEARQGGLVIPYGSWEFIDITGQRLPLLGDYEDDDGVENDADIAYPGARFDSATWVDKSSGDLWLFGGYTIGANPGGYLSDLWRYDATNNAWELITGTDAIEQSMQEDNEGNPIYPASRARAASWIDGKTLWLFGGDGNGDPDGQGIESIEYNDLWKFDTESRTWTFVVATGDTFDETPDYEDSDGPTGIQDTANPGSRADLACWTDTSGNLWLFGGYSGPNRYNDLWMYAVDSNAWVHVPESTDPVDPADYINNDGINIGLPARPSSRIGSKATVGIDGTNYLYSGRIGITDPPLRDLWSYDVGSNTWTKLLADEAFTEDNGDFFDSDGPENNNDIMYPPKLNGFSLTTAPDGSLWLYGGNYYTYYDQLWKYDVDNSAWVLLSGSPAVPNKSAVYPEIPPGDSIPTPGGRHSSTGWFNTAGDYYLFGGNGVGSFTTDLWKFNMYTQQGTESSVQSARYVSPTELSVTFSDPMGQLAEDPTNFTISGPGAGDRTQPSSVTQSSSDPNTYVLTWTSGNFASGNTVTITVDATVLDAEGAELAEPRTAIVFVPVGAWEFISGTGDYAGEPTDYDDLDGPGGNDTLNPGSRIPGASWTDEDGNLWVFGGTRFGTEHLNDLWKYTTATDTWELVSELIDYISVAGDYVDEDGAGPDGMYPGSRSNAASWTDRDGNLWLFGGYGFAASGSGVLSDLWKYDRTTTWTYVNGMGNNVGESGDYSDLDGVTGDDDTAHPGSRHMAATWTDDQGNLWLFGGFRYSTNGYGLLNDLWKFDWEHQAWALVTGSDVEDNFGNYNAGTAYPGSRGGATTWTDLDGNLWLFGGEGYATSDNSGYLNDLWKFDVTSETWEFVTGSGAYLYQTGDYTDVDGPEGDSDTAHPASRYGAHNWIDKSGNLWVFGGYSYGSATTAMNDLWMYDMANQAWIFAGGSGDYYTQFGDYTDTDGPTESADIAQPGSRFFGASWTDTDGNFWLFGGVGFTASTIGDLNDIWKYTISSPAAPTATSLLAAAYVSENDLSVTFSGPMGPMAEDAANYTISGPGAGDRAGTTPFSVTYSGNNTYVLTWNSGSFTEGQLVTITLDEAMEDAAGDPVEPPLTWNLMIPAASGSCNCGS